MSKEHKNFCRDLNYIDHSLIEIVTITGCVSISAFASLVGSSTIRLKTCVITAAIKRYKSIIKKKKEEAS